MIVQRREMALRIGLAVLAIPMHRIQLQWFEMTIANALTRATIWTQSGPQLPQVNWGCRQMFRSRDEALKFFASTMLDLRKEGA